MGVLEKCVNVKSERKENIKGWESCMGNKNIYICFGYVFMCVCLHHTEQASKMSGENKISPCPPENNKQPEADWSCFWRAEI